ncbi:hypothetical protein EDD11_010270, partial [Mortierella claussenii]
VDTHAPQGNPCILVHNMDQQRKREFSMMLKDGEFEEQHIEHVFEKHMLAHLQESLSCAGERLAVAGKAYTVLEDEKPR